MTFGNETQGSLFPKPETLLPPRYVVKSNALLRARWSAETILEPRLVALLASKIDTNDNDFKTYDIHVSELIGKEYGGRTLREIKNVIRKVMSRTVEINEGSIWKVYNVFCSCRLDSATGMFTLGFHPDLMPHYLQLKANFAKYSYPEFMKLPSVYSQRIFELLMSWKGQTEFVISVGELHEMLFVPPSLRKNFGDFRINVLDKAHKDIHKHTAVRYAWEPIKEGRRVISVKFLFTQKRVAESRLEAERKSVAKAQAKIMKAHKANHEAFMCCKQKQGVCTKRERSKTVCDVCHNEILGKFYPLPPALELHS